MNHFCFSIIQIFILNSFIFHKYLCLIITRKSPEVSHKNLIILACKDVNKV